MGNKYLLPKKLKIGINRQGLFHCIGIQISKIGNEQLRFGVKGNLFWFQIAEWLIVEMLIVNRVIANS
jgi:hypothetical protein